MTTLYQALVHFSVLVGAGYLFEKVTPYLNPLCVTFDRLMLEYRFRFDVWTARLTAPHHVEGFSYLRCGGRGRLYITPSNPDEFIVFIDRKTGSAVVKPHPQIVYTQSHGKIVSRASALSLYRKKAEQQKLTIVDVRECVLPIEKHKKIDRAIALLSTEPLPPVEEPPKETFREAIERMYELYKKNKAKRQSATV